jgi:hypothetical protein
MKIAVIVMIIGYLGCARVPKEVVELSYTVGKDINAVHVSYRQLIKNYFDNLRKQAEDFVDNQWAPAMLKRAIEKTELAKKIQEFEPKQVLDYLQAWTAAAIKRIQGKKDELLTPINEDERKLLAEVDDAFAKLTFANAVITQHLNSIRKVKELQDDVLSALGLKDLRDKIDNGMADASKKMQGMIDEIKKREDLLDTAKKDIEGLFK